ncbi:MAG: putative Holliday junction resolvase [Rickettsiales bacterium]|jgi:putative Holliday junction resolvase
MIYTDSEKLKQDLETKGRIIGLDLGTKTIGVAICDSDWTIATPKLTISRRGGKTDFLAIKTIIEANKIVAIVIGLPLNMDDSESKMSELVRKFAIGLDEFLNPAKIILFDERLSSFIAEELMNEAGTRNNRRKNVIDQIAAGIILQGLIDNF